MTGNASSTRRYLALWFPYLTSDRLFACRAAPAETFVTVAKVKGAIRIAALSPDAVDLGLTVGLGLADARARVPDLAVVEQDDAVDARWLERLASACERFTPMTALDPPDGLVLDLTGCLHAHDSEAALADRVAELFDMIRLRSAFADTPEAAQGLARFAVPSVAALPVAALRLDPEDERALIRAGLTMVGDLAERDTAPLAARFPGAAQALDRMLGRADSRIVPRRALPALQFECRFAEPVARVDFALEALAGLVAEAGAALDQRGQGGRRFTARLFRSDGAVRDLAVETALPTRDAGVVTRLFAERVEALADPIDPGFGFDLIRLAVPRAEPLTVAQLEFEGGVRADEALAALLDRIGVRLGKARVRRFVSRDTHIPERAAGTRPLLDAAEAIWPEAEETEPPLRPLQLLSPPQPIAVTAEVPDGPPRHFTWRGQPHRIALAEGPERISAEWWRARQGSGLTRDYYRVEDQNGRRFWIFRHGLFGREAHSPAWYLHGLFA